MKKRILVIIGLFVCFISSNAQTLVGQGAIGLFNCKVIGVDILKIKDGTYKAFNGYNNGVNEGDNLVFKYTLEVGKEDGKIVLSRLLFSLDHDNYHIFHADFDTISLFTHSVIQSFGNIEIRVQPEPMQSSISRGYLIFSNEEIKIKEVGLNNDLHLVHYSKKKWNGIYRKSGLFDDGGIYSEVFLLNCSNEINKINEMANEIKIMNDEIFK